MTALTVCVWTGSPLMALWIGSRVQGDGPPSMAAFGAVAASLAAISVVLVRLLGYVSGAYDRIVGRDRSVRRHVPWLRSMRGERPHEHGEAQRLSALDFILVASVIAAVLAFEVWFFFYSGSPIGTTTGRG